MRWSSATVASLLVAVQMHAATSPERMLIESCGASDATLKPLTIERDCHATGRERICVPAADFNDVLAAVLGGKTELAGASFVVTLWPASAGDASVPISDQTMLRVLDRAREAFERAGSTVPPFLGSMRSFVANRRP